MIDVNLRTAIFLQIFSDFVEGSGAAATSGKRSDYAQYRPSSRTTAGCHLAALPPRFGAHRYNVAIPEQPFDLHCYIRKTDGGISPHGIGVPRFVFSEHPFSAELLNARMADIRLTEVPSRDRPMKCWMPIFQILSIWVFSHKSIQSCDNGSHSTCSGSS